MHSKVSDAEFSWIHKLLYSLCLAPAFELHVYFVLSFRLDFNGFYTEKLEALSAEKALLETSSHSTESGRVTVKNPEKFGPGKIAVNILKIEQGGFIKE